MATTTTRRGRDGTPAGSAAVVHAEGLTRRFGAHRGVSDVALSIDAGEVFGFLGPNGAGKTTTIRLLLEPVHAHRGVCAGVRVFGHDPWTEAVAVHGRVGYLPGELTLYPRLTGRGFTRLVDEHFDDEEQSVVPLIAEHLDPTEWRTALAHASTFVRAHPRRGLALGGIVLDGVPAETRERLLDTVPLAVRTIFRLVGDRVCLRGLSGAGLRINA